MQTLLKITRPPKAMIVENGMKLKRDNDLYIVNYKYFCFEAIQVEIFKGFLHKNIIKRFFNKLRYYLFEQYSIHSYYERLDCIYLEEFNSYTTINGEFIFYE